MDAFKRRVADVAARSLGIDASQALELLERPRDPALGDLALPCFVVATRARRNPV
jgi:hypothetical protein